MGKHFLTSDTHFFHENVIEFCNRPYGSVEQMNEALIKNWNSVVGPVDDVWFLGDFSFGKIGPTEGILYRLNGIKHLIMGNHDRKGRCADLEWGRHFSSVHDYYLLHTDNAKAVLCHFPFASWERGYYNFHGHLHTTPGQMFSKWKQHDVGVDNNNYTPILFQDAMERSVKGKEASSGKYN
jgi:calcineurin-like phosphoesterase family protein